MTMTGSDTYRPNAPEFSRPVDVTRLKSILGKEFDVAPTEAELRALADLFIADKLQNVRFNGALKSNSKDEIELLGHLDATIVQPCVVTLVPVTTVISTDVHRLFVKELPANSDIQFDPEDDTDLEPLGPVIDLGLIASEELALAVPEYPRAPGAALPKALQGGGDKTEKGVRPFDVLKSLRDRLSDS